ncbi:3'-5' DNA helicase [Mycoemilia scoparia]|uniref:DNA helicase n=1 Tax=Mycoemilia scoparia TaxID=417184 RepID=A0A9W7ZUT1_9FUNG|nr:3'-5' DNA helicase [Mycoemilia scoparia]
MVDSDFDLDFEVDDAFLQVVEEVEQNEKPNRGNTSSSKASGAQNRLPSLTNSSTSIQNQSTSWQYNQVGSSKSNSFSNNKKAKGNINTSSGHNGGSGGQLTLFQSFSKTSPSSKNTSSNVPSAPSLWTSLSTSPANTNTANPRKRKGATLSSNRTPLSSYSFNKRPNIQSSTSTSIKSPNIRTPLSSHQLYTANSPNVGGSGFNDPALEFDFDSLESQFHYINKRAFSKYIYPLRYDQPARAYQQTAVLSCLRHNTLVALPTGLGKTLIAAVTMANYHRWFPNSLIIFVAPTKPLVSQQIRSCRGLLRAIIDSDKDGNNNDSDRGLNGRSPNRNRFTDIEMTEMNGSIPPATRKFKWQNSSFVFATPQVVDNDLKSQEFSIEDARRVSLVIIDEAHRATGRHAYCEFINELVTIQQDDYTGRQYDPEGGTGIPDMSKASGQFRLVALTATPGSKVETVQEIIDKLKISKIVIRTEESLDVAPYLHGRQTEVIMVTLPPWMIRARDSLAKCVQRSIRILSDKYKAMYKIQSEAWKITPYQIRMAQMSWNSQLPRGSTNDFLTKAIFGEYGLAMALAHIMKLLLQHGFGPAYNQFIELTNTVRQSALAGAKNGGSAKGVSKAKRECVASKEWADMSRIWIPLAKEINASLKEPLAAQNAATSNYFSNNASTNPPPSGGVRMPIENTTPPSLAGNQRALDLMPQNTQSRLYTAIAGTGNVGDSGTNNTSKPKYGHPKLEKVVELTVGHLEKFGKEIDDGDTRRTTRIIIFSQFRQSVEEIVRVLSEFKPLVKCTAFVGQGRGKGSDSGDEDDGSEVPNGNPARRGRGGFRGRGRGSQNGRSAVSAASTSLGGKNKGRGQSQKQQLEILSKFREGHFNTLVATCVGEEGLDIGEVDLIINYDTPASPIRLLQRVGRTGRARRGGVIVLLTAGTQEESSYQQAQNKYRSIQKSIESGKNILLHPELSPSMLPPNLPRGIPRIIQTNITEDDIKAAEAKYELPPTGGKRKGKAAEAGGKNKGVADTSMGFVKASDLDSYERLAEKYGRGKDKNRGISVPISNASDDDDLPSANDLLSPNLNSLSKDNKATPLLSSSAFIRKIISNSSTNQAILTPSVNIEHTFRTLKLVNIVGLINNQSNSSYSAGNKRQADVAAISEGKILAPNAPSSIAKKIKGNISKEKGANNKRLSQTNSFDFNSFESKEFDFTGDLDQGILGLAKSLGIVLPLVELSAGPTTFSTTSNSNCFSSKVANSPSWSELGSPGVIQSLLEEETPTPQKDSVIVDAEESSFALNSANFSPPRMPEENTKILAKDSLADLDKSVEEVLDGLDLDFLDPIVLSSDTDDSCSPPPRTLAQSSIQGQKTHSSKSGAVTSSTSSILQKVSNENVGNTTPQHDSKILADDSLLLSSPPILPQPLSKEQKKTTTTENKNPCTKKPNANKPEKTSTNTKILKSSSSINFSDLDFDFDLRTPPSNNSPNRDTSDGDVILCEDSLDKDILATRLTPSPETPKNLWTKCGNRQNSNKSIESDVVLVPNTDSPIKRMHTNSGSFESLGPNSNPIKFPTPTANTGVFTPSHTVQPRVLAKVTPPEKLSKLPKTPKGLGLSHSNSETVSKGNESDDSHDSPLIPRVHRRDRNMMNRRIKNSVILSQSPLIGEGQNTPLMAKLPKTPNINTPSILISDTPTPITKHFGLNIRSPNPPAINGNNQSSNYRNSPAITSPLAQNRIQSLASMLNKSQKTKPTGKGKERGTTSKKKKKSTIKATVMSKFIDMEVDVSDEDAMEHSGDDHGSSQDTDLSSFIDDRSEFTTSPQSALTTPQRGAATAAGNRSHKNGGGGKRKAQVSEEDIRNIYRQSLLSPVTTATQIQKELDEWKSKRKWVADENSPTRYGAMQRQVKQRSDGAHPRNYDQQSSSQNTFWQTQSQSSDKIGLDRNDYDSTDQSGDSDGYGDDGDLSGFVVDDNDIEHDSFIDPLPDEEVTPIALRTQSSLRPYSNHTASPTKPPRHVHQYNTLDDLKGVSPRWSEAVLDLQWECYAVPDIPQWFHGSFNAGPSDKTESDLMPFPVDEPCPYQEFIETRHKHVSKLVINDEILPEDYNEVINLHYPKLTYISIETAPRLLEKLPAFLANNKRIREISLMKDPEQPEDAVIEAKPLFVLMTPLYRTLATLEIHSMVHVQKFTDILEEFPSLECLLLGTCILDDSSDFLISHEFEGHKDHEHGNKRQKTKLFRQLTKLAFDQIFVRDIGCIDGNLNTNYMLNTKLFPNVLLFKQFNPLDKPEVPNRLSPVTKIPLILFFKKPPPSIVDLWLDTLDPETATEISNKCPNLRGITVKFVTANNQNSFTISNLSKHSSRLTRLEEFRCGVFGPLEQPGARLESYDELFFQELPKNSTISTISEDNELQKPLDIGNLKPLEFSWKSLKKIELVSSGGFSPKILLFLEQFKRLEKAFLALYDLNGIDVIRRALKNKYSNNTKRSDTSRDASHMSPDVEVSGNITKDAEYDPEACFNKLIMLELRLFESTMCRLDQFRDFICMFSQLRFVILHCNPLSFWDELPIYFPHIRFSYSYIVD